MKYFLAALTIGSVVLLEGACQENLQQLIARRSLTSNQTDFAFPMHRSDLNESEDQNQCLQITYNNTKQIFIVPPLVPPGYNHSIWFMSLKEEETISLQFDFSLPGTMADFPNHFFTYPIIPLHWHKLELVAGRRAQTDCRSWAELKISEINIERCLPHHTISRIQVSSTENLVIWSTCPPEGKWWEEMASFNPKENSGPGVSIYILAAFLAAAVIGLVIVGVYASYLRTSGKRNRENEESEYADWNAIEHKIPSTITPPSSASYKSNTGTIDTYLTS